MIVCPSCRTVNQEDLQFCSSCGRSLEPGPTTMLPRRPEEERPEIEIRTPKGPSKWRPVAIVGVVVFAAAAFGGYTLFRRDPCAETNFTSAAFGYCLTVPEGWTAEPARFGADVTLDQFAPPRDSATVIVEAVDLQDGAQLAGWADFVRRKDEGAGLIPGPASEAIIDGVAAQQWDVSVASEGGTDYQMREVVVVQNDIGWRITLNDVASSFDVSSATLERMLGSWRFR